jgi:hypothetical protein
MPRMLDLIRSSQVPVNLMQSAARGSLSVPPAEVIEILVYLAVHHKIFGQQARLTLAGWDEKSSLVAANDAATSPEVLEYWMSIENLRPVLLPSLLNNPSVKEESLSALATQGTRPVVDVLLTSPRTWNSLTILEALRSNAVLRPNELADIEYKLAGSKRRASDASSDEVHVPEEEIEKVLTHFLHENAVELEAEKDKPFQPIGGMREETGDAIASGSVGETTELEAGAVATASVPEPETKSATVAATQSAGAKPAAAATHARKPIHAVADRRDSPLQKISRLDVKGRIALAVRGSKEDRSILIRDGTKLVALAVLDSPKISDGEVEKIALQRNVLQSVLRAIPMKRRFAKNYSIMRNLVCNPRTPMDLSLGLIKNLLVHDLKNLSGNKDVPETVRKVALRMFKQKTEKNR